MTSFPSSTGGAKIRAMVGVSRPRALFATLAATTVAATGVAVTVPGAGSATANRQPIRVALVFDMLGPQSPVSRPSLPGLKRAIRTLGVEGTTITPTVKAGMVASFLTAGRQGYDLVIGIGSFAVEDAARAARELPAHRFASSTARSSSFRHRRRTSQDSAFATRKPVFSPATSRRSWRGAMQAHTS